MLNIFSVSFFGHRDFYEHHRCEKKLNEILEEILENKEYTEFLIGRNGEFDRFVASTIVKIKKEYKNSFFIWVLPYLTSDYIKNKENYEKYYDEIEICEKSSIAHPKSAIKIRNREIVERSDLIICYIEHDNGGAYETIEYAKKLNKKIINIKDMI